MAEEITTIEGLAAALQPADGQAKAPETESTKPAATEAEHEAQAPEAEAEGEQPEAEAEGAEGEATPEAETAQAPADEVVVKWKAGDGSEIEAPISELKSGYMRHADYTQKTQALAEERKQAAADIAKQYESAGQFVKEQAALVNVQTQLNAFARADWNALYAQNPAEAGRLQAQWKQLEEHGKALAADYQQKMQARQAQTAQEFQQRSQEALAELQREIPGFGDANLKTMREYGLKRGFSDAELTQVNDARMLKVLNDAAQWQALQSGKSMVQKKVQAAPPKTTKPGASAATKSAREKAWQHMQKARDLDSLAAVIAAQNG
jgi:hypothetical protein